MVAQMSLTRKQAGMLGDGSGIWSRIHIIDLSELFVLLVTAILDGKPELPTGKKGYFFAENGSQNWKSISEQIAKAGKKAGVFKDESVVTIALKEAADEFYDGVERDMEGVLGSKYVFVREIRESGMANH
jgi:hypothetical protein